MTIEMEPMSQWVIYELPSTLPPEVKQGETMFVVRQWLIGAGEQAGQLWLSEVTPYVDPFLENARRFVQTVQPGAVCLTRSEIDDPTIVETWL